MFWVNERRKKTNISHLNLSRVRIFHLLVLKKNANVAELHRVSLLHCNWLKLWIQGVPSRYDILWSPRLPTKIDLRVLKKVAAHLIGLGIWVLSIYFQKSNIGWPQQPLMERLPNISKHLDFWWFNPQNGTCISHFGARRINSSRSGSFLRKKDFGVAVAIEVFAKIIEAA